MHSKCSLAQALLTRQSEVPCSGGRKDQSALCQARTNAALLVVHADNSRAASFYDISSTKMHDIIILVGGGKAILLLSTLASLATSGTTDQ